VIEALETIARDLDALVRGAPYARAVREGVRLPLVGRPNVGKSSLFNVLLGEERAIVTDTPGTTRDRVSEPLEIRGIRVTLSDTAGLREAGEPVEAIGIERARRDLEESRLAVWVVDGSAALAAEDRWIAERLSDKRVLVALNKRDLPAAIGPSEVDGLLERAPRRRIVPVSAARREGMDDLREALFDLLDGPRGGLPLQIGNPRHVEAFERGRTALERAASAARDGAPGEIVALELRETLAALGEVTGRTVDEDLLERIFSRFCVGK
jgi:tRNA modification GTPase